MIIILGLIEVYNVSSANNPVSQGDYLQRAPGNDARGSGLKSGFNGACFGADSVAVLSARNTRRNFLLCVRWDKPLFANKVKTIKCIVFILVASCSFRYTFIILTTG